MLIYLFASIYILWYRYFIIRNFGWPTIEAVRLSFPRGLHLVLAQRLLFSDLISDRFQFREHSSVSGGVIEADSEDEFVGSLSGRNFYLLRIAAIF
jgi:hypothetical protein